MMEKLVATRRESPWLASHEVALLLESARTHAFKRTDRSLPFLFPFLATFALTGGRESEILGLEVPDVAFERNTITFRPNDWRRLRTATSAQTVPLLPQLAEILRDYLSADSIPRRAGLAFPTRLADPKSPAMLTDLRKPLDAVAERVGWKKGEVRSRAFRHPYCAARLQALDRGESVSRWTVAKELGHGGDTMVRRVYGHLGAVRHRSEHFEFRVENHREALASRLRLLAA
jgi:integrase